jgi:hypothetical protein
MNENIVGLEPRPQAGCFEPADPILSEREFIPRLRFGAHETYISVEDDYCALLNEFFITLPERIAFWAKARNDEIARNVAVFGGDGENDLTNEIYEYCHRLEWAADRERDREFLTQPAVRRFYFIAVALHYGSTSARRFWHGTGKDLCADDGERLAAAVEQLEFLIVEERGQSVRFQPTRQAGTCEQKTQAIPVRSP